MAFTKAYAKILAGMLGDDEKSLLLFLMGRGPKNLTGIEEKVVESLEELELAKRKTIDGGKLLMLVTNRGKKVAAEL